MEARIAGLHDVLALQRHDPHECLVGEPIDGYNAQLLQATSSTPSSRLAAWVNQIAVTLAFKDRTASCARIAAGVAFDSRVCIHPRGELAGVCNRS